MDLRRRYNGSKQSGGSWDKLDLLMHSSCMRGSKAFTLLDIHVTQIGKRTVLDFAPTVHEHRPECPRPGSVVAQFKSAALLKGSAIVLAELPATIRFDGTHC